MGMYLSVYAYKGCEHLVQGWFRPLSCSLTTKSVPGVDKDIVCAGLAGGRLGNKGGMYVYTHP